jgi:hypothetical protein
MSGNGRVRTARAIAESSVAVDSRHDSSGLAVTRTAAPEQVADFD